MGKSGKKLTLDTPKYGNKSLVTSSQEKDIKKRKLMFSFSFFKQIKHFELDECSKEWHIGLLERLQTLGNMTLQEILEDNKGSKALRCHPIDWNAKNVPIQRKDLNWLPKEILDNEEDFPMMQIAISTSTGRIVGYIDRDSSIFHIVLLDPKHNIQPSKKNDYQVQPTQKAVSQYDELLKKLELVRDIVKDCKDKDCKLHGHIESMDKLHQNIVYIGLDDDFYDKYQEIFKKHSLEEIFETGIMEMMDEDEKTKDSGDDN